MLKQGHFLDIRRTAEAAHPLQQGRGCDERDLPAEQIMRLAIRPGPGAVNDVDIGVFGLVLADEIGELLVDLGIGRPGAVRSARRRAPRAICSIAASA